MSEDYKYLDDPEITDFNENLDARAAQQMEEGAISPLMFGPTGRGLSPEIELRANRKLYSDAAKALRSEGMNDDSHLKDPTNLVLNEQQQKEADEKQFDKMLDNMYKEMKKPVARSTSSSKKGGARKRSSRRRSTRRRSTKKRSIKSKKSKKSKRISRK
jgi:hypothetical protein